LLGYLAAIAVVLLLTKWGFSALRKSPRKAALGPRNEAEPGLLRTVALLTGPNFDEDPGDDPQSMGEPLARALQEGLCARGYAAQEPYASSHGYELALLIEGLTYLVSCGLRGGSEDDEAVNEWLVLVKQSASARGASEPTKNSDNARKLVAALAGVFDGLPGLRRVTWQADDDAFLRGAETWHATPF
jgi:hypothetical protein